MQVENNGIKVNVLGGSPVTIFTVPTGGALLIEQLELTVYSFGTGQTRISIERGSTNLPLIDLGVVGSATFLAPHPITLPENETLQLVGDGSNAGVATFGFKGTLLP